MLSSQATRDGQTTVKALITGASGFIGAHLATALTGQGHHVRCLVRPSSRVDHLSDLGAELAFGDVTDPHSVATATKGVDVVFHLAGLIKALNYDELLRVNEQGSRNVAQACADQGKPPVMILVSSLAAAGPSQSDRPRLETDPAQPVSNYGRSKRAGELAATSFADRIPLTIVRPPVVFGEGDLSMLSMVRPIKLLRLHLVPGFTGRRASMIHAADLVAGLITAAERGERIVPGDNEGTARGFYFLADEAARRLPNGGSSSPVRWVVAGCA